MHPTSKSSAGWLLSPVAEFDGLIDAADRLVGLLAVVARNGDTDAAAEIADLHRRVRALNNSDKTSVEAFSEEVARRAAELTE